MTVVRARREKGCATIPNSVFQLASLLIMIKITRSLPVSLDQILHFDVYKSALEQTLSLEPPMADFLKSREGIKMWLNRLETFETFRY